MADRTEDTRQSARPHSYYEAKNVAYRAWAIVGCVVVFVLCIRGLAMIGPALELLLVGIVVGFLCSPITNWLEDRGVARGLAAFLALVVVVAIMWAVLWMLVPSVISETVDLLRRTPYFIAQARSFIDDFLSSAADSADPTMQETVSSIVSSASSSINSLSNSAIKRLTSGLIPLISGTITNLFTFFLGLVLAYWFARDYPVLFRELSIIAGPEHESDISLMFAVMSRAMSGYMRSTLYTAVIAGFLSFAGYALVGHPYASLMGITMGVLHIIPVVGPWIAAFFAILLGLSASPMVALWALVVAVVAMNVTDNLIGPLVMQSAVQVHPILSLVAITVGASLGGIIGMILAIPLSAAIKGGYIYYFETRTGRQLVSYDGALFKSTPYSNRTGSPVPTLDALDDDEFFEKSRLVTASETPSASPAEPPEQARRTIPELLRRRLRRRSQGSVETRTVSKGAGTADVGSAADGEAADDDADGGID